MVGGGPQCAGRKNIHRKHMKKEKHTPGPWLVTGIQGSDCLMVGGDDGSDVVADIRIRDDGAEHINASLIAAAPELLAALKRAEALLAIAYNPGIEDSVTLTATRCQHAANWARAAIAKAEGRA